jgi:hypothetical protein
METVLRRLQYALTIQEQELMVMKEVKTRRMQKLQPYNQRLKNDNKNEYGKCTQIQKRIFKAIRTKPHGKGKH